MISYLTCCRSNWSLFLFFLLVLSGKGAGQTLPSSFSGQGLGVLPMCWVLKWGPHLRGRVTCNSSLLFLWGWFSYSTCGGQPQLGSGPLGSCFTCNSSLLLLGRGYRPPSDHHLSDTSVRKADGVRQLLNNGAGKGILTPSQAREFGQSVCGFILSMAKGPREYVVVPGPLTLYLVLVSWS